MLEGIAILGFLGFSLANSLGMSTRQQIAKDMLDRDKDPYRFAKNNHILHPVVDRSNSTDKEDMD